MDRRMAEIEHLISHYLHRDLFRIHVREYVRRTGQLRSALGIDAYHLMPVSHFKANGDRPEDWHVIEYTVHNLRVSLKRCKPITVRYLHDLLHTEPLLSDHEHTHADGVIFTYVIQEVDFL